MGMVWGRLFFISPVWKVSSLSHHLWPGCHLRLTQGAYRLSMAENRKGPEAAVPSTCTALLWRCFPENTNCVTVSKPVVEVFWALTYWKGCGVWVYTDRLLTGCCPLCHLRQLTDPLSFRFLICKMWVIIPHTHRGVERTQWNHVYEFYKVLMQSLAV